MLKLILRHNLRYSKIRSRYYNSYCLTTTIIECDLVGITRKKPLHMKIEV